MVSNGQAANANTFNNAFLSRTGGSGSATSTTAKVALQNASDVNSGKFVVNIQRYLNNLALVVGLSLAANGSAEADATGNAYGADATSGLADGTNIKAALKYLANKFTGATTIATVAGFSHTHSGVDGDGAPIDFSAAGARSGQLALTNGVSTMDIALSSDFGSTNYFPVVALENTTDTDFAWITCMVTAKTSSQFTVKFSAPIDSANYKLNFWLGKTV